MTHEEYEKWMDVRKYLYKLSLLCICVGFWLLLVDLLVGSNYVIGATTITFGRSNRVSCFDPALEDIDKSPAERQHEYVTNRKKNGKTSKKYSSDIEIEFLKYENSMSRAKITSLENELNSQKKHNLWSLGLMCFSLSRMMESSMSTSLRKSPLHWKLCPPQISKAWKDIFSKYSPT